jgi:hypothetical protein
MFYINNYFKYEIVYPMKTPHITKDQRGSQPNVSRIFRGRGERKGR